MSIAPETKARLEAAGHEAALSYVDTLADQKAPLYQYVFRYFDLPYVIIPQEKRDHYLDALEAANRGDMVPLTDFVAEQYEHSLDQVLDQTPGHTSVAGE